MNEADMMFIARDASIAVLSEFCELSVDFEADRGKLVFGNLIAEHEKGRRRPERLGVVSLAGVHDRDDFMRRVQDHIESAIRKALVRHAEDSARQYKGGT